MILLLDTHTFLWYVQNDPLLSLSAKQLIQDPANRKLVSVVSCWEIAIKAGLRKLRFGQPTSVYIPNAMAAAGFDYLPIELTHVFAVEGLGQHHRDPFDRLLIAQAHVEAVSIVSIDTALDPYGVTRLW